MGLEREARRQLPPLRRPALRRPRHHPRDALAAAPRATRATATSCGGATSTTMVAEQAGRAGARCSRAPRPAPDRSRDGLLAGAVVKDKAAGEERELHARYVVIADGSNSRFGRALGTSATSGYPQGMAIRGYFESPLHAEPWIESRPRRPRPQRRRHARLRLDLPVRRRDHQRRHRAAVHVPRLARGQHLPPDDGVGGHRARRTGGSIPTPWSARPPAAGCRWPARSTRRSGPTWIVIGDAAGSINPFNGEGIDYAYETGRMAAGLIDEALAIGTACRCQRYPRPARGRVRPLLQGGPAVRAR